VPEPSAAAGSEQSPETQRVISVRQLAALGDGPKPVLLIDLSSQPVYSRKHIPGAVWFDFKALVYSRPPVVGLMPDIAKLAKSLGHNGLTTEHKVVAYDDENGLKASRLLWTLDAIGHTSSALLDGGLEAWELAGLQRHNIRRDSAVRDTTPAYPAAYHVEVNADRAYIESHLNDPDIRLLDARSSAEFRGSDQRAARAGHIPGAVNIEWSRCLDPDNGLYLRPAEQLTSMLAGYGITPDKEIICYCQTHRRSAFMYVMLKNLGFPRVRGYPGSWSEWGNLYDASIE
jgi:thiosulfate/3-mercaptopyruvate sulfurtransferase